MERRLFSKSKEKKYLLAELKLGNRKGNTLD